MNKLIIAAIFVGVLSGCNNGAKAKILQAVLDDCPAGGTTQIIKTYSNWGKSKSTTFSYIKN